MNTEFPNGIKVRLPLNLAEYLGFLEMLLGRRLANDHSAFHDETDSLQKRYVVERVSCRGDDVGEFPGLNGPDVALCLQKLRG